MTSTEEIYGSYNFYVCVLVLYLCGTIASAGGIGGGGVNVPLLLVIGGYSYREAVVFSLCTVLGNSLAQSIINWPLSHPYVKRRPLIYWEIILFLLPAQLGGSNVGVIIGKLFPEELLLCCALLVLLLAIAKTYYKGMSFLKEERKSVTNKSTYQKIVNFATEIENSRKSSLQDNSTLYNVVQSESMIANPSMTYATRRESDTSTVALYNPLRNEQSYQFNNSILSVNDFDFTADTAVNADGNDDDQLGGEGGHQGDEEEVEEKLSPISPREKEQDITETLLPQAQVAQKRSSVEPTFGSAQILNLPSLEGKGAVRRNSANSANSRITHRQLPYPILQALLVVFLCYVGFFLVLQFTTELCSTQYYAIIGSIYLPLFLFIYWAMSFVRTRQKTDPICSKVRGDIDMEKQSVVIVGVTFVVGILCSLLGIGGGELMGPLLLTYHLLPPVSTATTSMMSMINTTNNVIHYGIQGEINYAVGVVFFFVGLTAGATGRFTALHLVRKYNKNSILVFMLFTILSLSASLLVYEIITSEHDWSFHPLC